MDTLHVPSWTTHVEYGENGPVPKFLWESDELTVIIGGLAAGETIPSHSEAQAMYQILEGRGTMTVDNERFPIEAGSIVVVPDGAVRGMEAGTRLAFLAARIKDESRS